MKQKLKNKRDGIRNGSMSMDGSKQRGNLFPKYLSLLLLVTLLVNLVPLGVFASSATLSGIVTIPQAVPAGQSVQLKLYANHNMGSTTVSLSPGQTTASYSITLDLTNYQDTYLNYAVVESGGIDMVSSGIYKNDAGHNICYSESDITALFDPITNGQSLSADFSVPLGYAVSGTISLPNGDNAPAGGLRYNIASGYGISLQSAILPQGSTTASYRIVMPPSTTSTIACNLYDQTSYCNANYYNSGGTAPYYNGGEVLSIASPLMNVDIQLIPGYLISGKVYLPSGVSNTGNTAAISAIIAQGASYRLTSEASFSPGTTSATYQLMVPCNFSVTSIMANSPTGGTIAGMFMPSYYSTTTLSTMSPGASSFSVTGNTTKNIALILYPATTAVIPTYTVTFDKNGGDTDASPGSLSVVEGGTVSTLPAQPTRANFTFSGWNSANGSGSPFTTLTVVSGNMTVYAQWTPVASTGSSSGRGGGITVAAPIAQPSGTPPTGISNMISSLSALNPNQVTGANLTNQISRSLGTITSALGDVNNPTQAQAVLGTMPQTLETVAGLLQNVEDRQAVVGQLSELTNTLRGTVQQSSNLQATTNFAVGYMENMAPVLQRLDPASQESIALRNNLQGLAQEVATRIGEISPDSSRVSISNGTAAVSYDSTQVSTQIEVARQRFEQVSTALNTLMGDGDRPVQLTVTLQSPRPANVSAMTGIVSDTILNAARSNGIHQMALAMGETTVAFNTGILPQGQHNLNLAINYAPIPTGGVPGNVTTLQGGFVADVALSTERGIFNTFENPVQLSFDLSAQNLAQYTAQDLNRLGIYLQNESTGIWEPVGGNYDPVTHVIRTFRGHLSKYTVMKSVKSFSDIENSWAKDDINELLGKGIVQEQPRFSPKEGLTREEFTRWIAKAYGLQSNVVLPFTDVTKTSPNYHELAAVYSHGLIKGRSSTQFDPKGKITRQEMAVLISGALKKFNQVEPPTATAARLGKYSDGDKVAVWAKDSMALAIDLGIIQGDAGKIRPTDTITKEEAARLFSKLYN